LLFPGKIKYQLDPAEVSLIRLSDELAGQPGADAEWNKLDASTFCGGGAKGYTDYPDLS